MNWITVKTKKFIPPKDDLYEELEKLELKEKDILIITSKVVSIHEGKCIRKGEDSRDTIIRREADYILERKGTLFPMTIKDSQFIPFSGVDESNGDDHLILLPENPDKTAEEIHNYLIEKNKIKDLGILIVDSNCLPLRFGLIGTCIGFHGIKPIRDYGGKEDLFGRELKISRINVLDSIAAFSTLLIGQGNEQTPMAILRDCNLVEFDKNGNWDDLQIDLDKDFYSPFVELFKRI